MGCIQARTCHTSRCPTGVTTQDWLRGKAAGALEREWARARATSFEPLTEY